MLRKNGGKGEGHIVSVASCMGLGGGPYLTDYCASKGAAIMFMDALRIELKSLNKAVLCTHICPWVINTGMFEGTKVSLLTPFLK